MFAEDTTLINAGLTSAFTLQKDFDAVSDWLTAGRGNLGQTNVK